MSEPRLLEFGDIIRRGDTDFLVVQAVWAHRGEPSPIYYEVTALSLPILWLTNPALTPASPPQTWTFTQAENAHRGKERRKYLTDVNIVGQMEFKKEE